MFRRFEFEEKEETIEMPKVSNEYLEEQSLKKIHEYFYKRAMYALELFKSNLQHSTYRFEIQKGNHFLEKIEVYLYLLFKCFINSAIS